MEKKRKETDSTKMTDEQKEKLLKRARNLIKRTYTAQIDQYVLLAKQAQILSKEQNKPFETFIDTSFPEKVLSEVREKKQELSEISVEFYEDLENSIIKKINKIPKKKRGKIALHI